MKSKDAGRNKPTSKRAGGGARRRAEECLDRSLKAQRIAFETADRGWRRFTYRSVEGYAFIDATNGVLDFTVMVDIMPLPSDNGLIVPLMRELLEANSFCPGPARFAILQDRVQATATTPVASLREEDYGAYAKSVALAARQASGALSRRYGGTTRKRPEPNGRRRAPVGKGATRATVQEL